MMGNIAANAASMAIGSTVARGIGSALGWNGVQQVPAEGQAVDQQQQQPQQYGQYQQTPTNSCDSIAKDFAKCLSATNNDVAPCQYYLCVSILSNTLLY